MTAYWISTYHEIRDPERFRAYAELAKPALTEAGGTYLARDTAAAAWESGVLERSVLVEFPTVDAAIAAHDGPAYQAALEALGDAVVRDVRIVPGVEPVTPVDHP